MSWRDETAQILRFAAVGLTQNAGNLGLFALQVELGVGYLAAAALAGVAALLLSFLLNRGWTFRQRQVRRGTTIVRYSAVFVSAVGLGMVLLTVQVELLAVPRVLGQVIAIAVVAPVSYLVQREWVFS